MYDGQIAPIWGQQVIKIVRQRTKELGEDYVALIEEIVAWAEQHGATKSKASSGGSAGPNQSGCQGTCKRRQGGD